MTSTSKVSLAVHFLEPSIEAFVDLDATDKDKFNAKIWDRIYDSSPELKEAMDGLFARWQDLDPFPEPPTSEQMQKFVLGEIDRINEIYAAYNSGLQIGLAGSSHCKVYYVVVDGEVECRTEYDLTEMPESGSNSSPRLFRINWSVPEIHDDKEGTIQRAVLVEAAIRFQVSVRMPLPGGSSLIAERANAFA